MENIFPKIFHGKPKNILKTEGIMRFLGVNFNITNPQNFQKGLELIQQSIATPDHFYASDNIITWNRNFSFLQDKNFIKTVQKNSNTDIELSIIWRTYILCYFAKIALHLNGDFLEIGAYKGNTANIILETINLEKTTKNYYLYDTFEHQEKDLNHKMPEHSKELFEKVKNRFKKHPFVKVIKGYVPQSFDEAFPEKIAFAHIDLNQAPAELAALNAVLPKLVKGGVIILDDYGWWGYHEQKETQDPVLTAHGLKALELPTGQGIVIKDFGNDADESAPPPRILELLLSFWTFSRRVFMNNILLTGGTGFVGFPLRNLLKQNKISVKLILRKPAQLFENESAIYTKDFFNENEYFFEDALNNIQTVVHLAWYTEHGKYQFSPLNETCKNASILFAQVALKNKLKHFIGIGTCYEYQKQKTPLGITTPLKPFTPYGKAKAELYLTLNDLFKNSPTRFSWARLFYMFGENEYANRLTPSLHRHFQNKEKIKIKNANAILDFLDTQQVAEKLFSLIVSKEKTENNSYNICSGKGISLQQYAENIAKEYNAFHYLEFLNSPNPDFIVGIPTEIK